MILLHEKLPCSENFFRYFKNYDKYVEGGQKSPVGSDHSGGSASSDKQKVERRKTDTLAPMLKVSTKVLESPKYGLGMSPINQFLSQNSPLNSPLSTGSAGKSKYLFNVDTQSQKMMLQQAAHNLKTGEGGTGSEQLKPEVKYEKYIKENSPRTVVQSIKIEQFKTSKM